jgi:hypothetical protein
MSEYTDGGFGTPIVGKSSPIPASGAPTTGTSVVYSSRCVPDTPGATTGHIELTETATTTYLTPALAVGLTGGKSQPQVIVNTVIVVHTIITTKKCFKLKEGDPAPYGADDSKSAFLVGQAQIAEDNKNEEKKPKNEEKKPK